MFLRIVFENIENTVWVFSENCSCSLNLVFSVFFMFSVFFNKKYNIYGETKHVLPFSLFFLFLRTENNTKKQ